MANENNAKREKDFFWQVQGLNSFCKAKSDLIHFEKVHLSFVKHKGKPECISEASVEAYLPYHGETGALYLSELILSGALKKLATSSRQKAAEEEASSGKKVYPKAVFSSMGGSDARTYVDKKTNQTVSVPCTYREFTVSPGAKSDYVLQVMSCEGEVNSIGGFSPKKGSTVTPTRINVPVSSALLVDFALSVQTEYQAYITAQKVAKAVNREPEPPAYEAPAVVQPTVISAAVAIYDASGNYRDGEIVLVGIDKAESVVQDAIKFLLGREEKYRADSSDYGIVANAIKGKLEGTYPINMTGKFNPEFKTQLVVIIGNL